MRTVPFQLRPITVLLLVSMSASEAAGQSEAEITVNAATTVLDAIMSSPGKEIPAQLMKEARGVAIIPGVVKGGFIVGVRLGRGVILTKDDNNTWRSPTFISLSGGSVGWQAGIQSTDLVLVFKTNNSVQRLMTGMLKIGVDAAAAAGPVGREAAAATDASLSAEIYSYSRSRGLFAGVSLEGSGLQVDQLAQQAYYRSDVSGNPTVQPESARRLIQRVAHYTGTDVDPSLPPLPTGNPPNGSQPEAIRQQLVASWTPLSLLLDNQWQAFLAIPSGLLTGQQHVSAQDLTTTLKRYESIASNPQYASLTNRQEFQATLHWLREYIASQSPVARRIELPPPPAINNAAVPIGNY